MPAGPRRWGALLVILAGGLGCGRVGYEARAEDGPLESRIGPGDRIPWQGSDFYLHGVSVPWRRWGLDVGDPELGVSNPVHLGLIRERVAAARADGAGVVRWLLFGGLVAFERNADGTPAAAGPQLLSDLETVVALAEELDVHLVLTLF